MESKYQSVLHRPDHLCVDVALPDDDVLQREGLHPSQLEVSEVRGLALCSQNHFQNVMPESEIMMMIYSQLDIDHCFIVHPSLLCTPVNFNSPMYSMIFLLEIIFRTIPKAEAVKLGQGLSRPGSHGASASRTRAPGLSKMGNICETPSDNCSTHQLRDALPGPVFCYQ